MEFQKLEPVYGRASRNLVGSISDRSLKGALAALETFYYAFNNKDLATFKQIWIEHDLVQLNNPLGGILRGIDPITKLYETIFGGNAEIWVELHDIVQYTVENCVVFAGREQGHYIKNSHHIDLHIRTTRIFAYVHGAWGQVHHHGSIDDPELLKDYQGAIAER